MDQDPIFKPLTALPPDIETLRAEAATEGFRFMDKLVDEWQSGANRFAAPGERFLGAIRDDRLVAVGGLNIDPYAHDLGMARLRHVYVLPRARRQGIAGALVRRLLDGARDAGFASVRLRTDTTGGAGFYEALGFSRLSAPDGSHIIVLARPVS